MDYRRLLRAQGEIQGERIGERNEMLFAVFPCYAPVSIPKLLQRRAGAGDTWAWAIDAFRVKELFVREIAESEMSKIDIAEIPCGILFRIPAKPPAEESKLETKFVTV